MKWPQGLAVITRAEHWDMASKHLWGLSSSQIAAYLHVAAARPKPSASIEPARIPQSSPEISPPSNLGSNLLGDIR
jgi:hypothetical protein